MFSRQKGFRKSGMRSEQGQQEQRVPGDAELKLLGDVLLYCSLIISHSG